MPPYGEPDWVTPGDISNAAATENPGTFASVVQPTASNGNTSSTRNNAKLWIAVLSFINIGLAGAMGALGVLTLIDFKASNFNDFTVAFLSAYMILFAGILFCYELVWWQPFPKVNLTYRKNFGFMYRMNGKGFYLIFIAFLCLGLKDEAKNHQNVQGLNWATGIGWLAVGCLHIFLSCTSPDLVEAYKPPTAGLSPSEAGNNVV